MNRDPHIDMKFRSHLEERIARSLEKQNVPFLYEAKKYNYILECNYTPDFFIHETIIEAKGFFKPSSRRLMVAVKKQLGIFATPCSAAARG